MSFPLLLAVTLALPTAGTAAKKDVPREVAVAYLKALEGKGDDSAREYLLGELTLTAEDVSIPNWKIVSREKRSEVKNIASAVKAMREVDSVGRATLDGIVHLEEDEESVLQITQQQAEKLLLPTKRKSEEFARTYPVFSYAARVGKDVYWHPSNPWRALVSKLGDDGKYRLDLHLFRIEEVSGGKKRVWPLRVLRIKTKTFDSGWKILPASNWDPEY